MRSRTPGNDIEARFVVEHGGFTLDLDLALPGRGVTAIFGHSGSGKTTLLRCLAGLARPTQGRLVVDGEVWLDTARRILVPTHRRPLGYVFQEASLFPHLSVLKNLRFGLDRVPAAMRRVDLAHAAELLGITHLLDRMPAGLSGGERQRVGIARALLTSPRLLLLDEPLASLDQKRKLEILPYLERLHDELDIPMLYVSHAPEEVARLADHLVLLDAGRALASGPITETLARLDLPMALADDASVVLEGVVAGYDARYGLLTLALPGGQASLTVLHASAATGQTMRVAVKARDVSLVTGERRETQTSVLNVLAASVVAIAADTHPSQAVVRLDIDGSPLLARVTRYSLDRLRIAVGMRVWAQVKAVSLLA
ncbi:MULTISPECIES: molybdenum ABC transporter ATP-binding protein [unclassified Caballeronia]|uniref:molybdenum ABC transporter ATP-binding protein n=1 Tax=unclassified Caballeronia TaxID=2646786 RepID=UPI00285865D2|nr:MULTISPECIES: molybdenum ABC transporter ATP-binding protein [unclassified Caballeronia]MDR5740898.1 molybdenum ABC transporter ATP-binding protein [Caballeronia sp. LZ016]MDR5808581.1 molybdenum ABC transporter ATP-binding protein [Caballeronia sp. LZ019]